MKFINNAVVGIDEVAFMQFNCMVNGEKHASENICMTVDHFKRFIDACQNTLKQYEQLKIEKAAMN